MTLARETDRIGSERLLLRRIDHADLEFLTQMQMEKILDAPPDDAAKDLSLQISRMGSGGGG
jgi:hypothetical protein